MIKTKFLLHIGSEFNFSCRCRNASAFSDSNYLIKISLNIFWKPDSLCKESCNHYEGNCDEITTKCVCDWTERNVEWCLEGEEFYCRKQHNVSSLRHFSRGSLITFIDFYWWSKLYINSGKWLISSSHLRTWIAKFYFLATSSIASPVCHSYIHWSVYVYIDLLARY